MSASLNAVRFARRLKRAAALRQHIEIHQKWMVHNGRTLYGYRHKFGPKGQRQYLHDCNLLQSLEAELAETGLA